MSVFLKRTLSQRGLNLLRCISYLLMGSHREFPTKFRSLKHFREPSNWV